MKVQAGKRELIIETVIENGETLVAARPVLEAFNAACELGSSKTRGGIRSGCVTGVRESRAVVCTFRRFRKQLGIRSHWYEPEQMLKLSVWLIRMEKLELAGGGLGR